MTTQLLIRHQLLRIRVIRRCKGYGDVLRTILRLPDDGKRYEIIEGVLYVANAPGYDHQFTVTKLLSICIVLFREHKLGIGLTCALRSTSL